MYADELVFVKSNLIFRRLPACRQVCLHAELLIAEAINSYYPISLKSEISFIRIAYVLNILFCYLANLVFGNSFKFFFDHAIADLFCFR